MTETPDPKIQPGSNNSSFENMVHKATTSVLADGAIDDRRNIAAQSMATGTMTPSTPPAINKGNTEGLISPVETFSLNENEVTILPSLSGNVHETTLVSPVNENNIISPVVTRDNADFMSTSLAVDNQDDLINLQDVDMDEEEIKSIDTDKEAVMKQVDTCPTGSSNDEEDQPQSDEEASEHGTNKTITNLFHRLQLRPAWLWILICLVLVLAAVIAVIVGLGLLDEDSKINSAKMDESVFVPEPTAGPSTLSPTTLAPTDAPSFSPSEAPTTTVMPSERPSLRPSMAPSSAPSISPSGYPTVSPAPSHAPSMLPSDLPSDIPSSMPTELPSDTPSDVPSTIPSSAPTDIPSTSPTFSPTTGTPTVSAAPTMATYVLLLDVLNTATETPIEALSDPSTPQGRALLWMSTEDQVVLDLVESSAAQQDPMVIVMTDANVDSNGTSTSMTNATALTPPSPTSELQGLSQEALFHLPQRFAVVALDISLHANSDILWSFPRLHECEWPGIRCDRSEEIIEINWARQNLTGYVVPEIGLLTELEKLDLAQNQLTGFLDDFWNLSQLKTLYLHENQFMGSIGSEIENMLNLEFLYLGKNELTGQIPEELFDLRDLRYLILHSNQLTGALPNIIRMNDMYYFDVSDNQLQGTLPDLRMAQLRHFHMEHNRFTGTIPREYANLGSNRLFQFFLNDNFLEGGFPGDWHTKHPHKFLTNVDISNNRLTSRIPDSVCKLSVYEEGETIEFRADCDVCRCSRLCYRWCSRDRKDYHNYLL